MTISLDPLPVAEWAKLPEREQNLQIIADNIAWWLRWSQRTDGGPLNPDTHLYLPGDNEPPKWPTVGQLMKWLEILRDRDGSGEAGQTAEQAGPEGREPGPKASPE